MSKMDRDYTLIEELNATPNGRSVPTVWFRKLKVESGWMYNFWNVEKDDYNEEWIFVPITTL